MLRTFLLATAIVIIPGLALADPAANPNSQQSCVAVATLAYKSTPASEASGNNGNGVAVREQAKAGTRGEGVSALAQSCKGSTQAP